MVDVRDRPGWIGDKRVVGALIGVVLIKAIAVTALVVAAPSAVPAPIHDGVQGQGNGPPVDASQPAASNDTAPSSTDGDVSDDGGSGGDGGDPPTCDLLCVGIRI